jgi:hypothetical protein
MDNQRSQHMCNCCLICSTTYFACSWLGQIFLNVNSMIYIGHKAWTWGVRTLRKTRHNQRRCMNENYIVYHETLVSYKSKDTWNEDRYDDHNIIISIQWFFSQCQEDEPEWIIYAWMTIITILFYDRQCGMEGTFVTLYYLKRSLHFTSSQNKSDEIKLTMWTYILNKTNLILP